MQREDWWREDWWRAEWWRANWRRADGRTDGTGTAATARGGEGGPADAGVTAVPPLRGNLAGVLWATAGTFLFTFVFASGKLTDGAVPVVQILWLRYVAGFITVLVLVLTSRSGLPGHRSPRPHWHFVRAVFGVSGGACATQAATLMPIADATAIGLTEGLMIVLLAIVLLGERVALMHWLAVLLSAVGALLVVKGNGPDFTPTLGPGALFALAGAALIAAESILIKTLSARESPLSVLLHVNGFGILLLAGPALWLWTDAGPWLSWVGLALGPLAITAQFCWIRAFQAADAAIAGPIGYSWILFAALLGVVVWGEVPTLATLSGSVLVCTGGVMLARLPRRT